MFAYNGWVFMLGILLLATLTLANESNVYITTIVGGGACDGGLAINACLASPKGSAMGPDGSIFIADSGNNRVRQVFPNGTITTLAGTGISGFNGDGIPATSALLKSPQGVLVNSLGEVFISDAGNSRIRKVLKNGTITTYAGIGVDEFSGDGELAVNAGVRNPYQLAWDSKGELLIAEVSSNRIRKVMSNGTIITIAGNYQGYGGDNGLATNARLKLPRGVAVDSDDNFYIADCDNHRIRKVFKNGMIITLAGDGFSGFSGDGGPSTSSKISFPEGVAVSPSGDLYFASNYRIRAVLTNGTIVTVFGTGKSGYNDNTSAITAMFITLGLIHFGWNSSDLYISDMGQYRVRKVSNGIINTVAGTGSSTYCGENILSTMCSIGTVEGAAIDVFGNIYIADTNNNRVRKVSHLDGTITTIAGTGFGGYNGDGILATDAQIFRPSGVAVDSKGSVYIADSSNNRVRKILTNGTIITIAGNGVSGYNGDQIKATEARLKYPFSLAFDSDDRLYISDLNNNRIRCVLANGNITTVIGLGTGGFNGDYLLPNDTMLFNPRQISFDSVGNLIIADSNNNRIRKMFTNGTIITIAGTGSTTFNGDGMLATLSNLKSPQGFAIDNDEIIIADTSNNRIRRILSNGTLISIIGTGDKGFSEDGSVASTAKVSSPTAVIVKRNGELIVVEKDNYRLRLISTSRTCNGTLASDTTVCNGVGFCDAPDFCDCGDLYGGQFCEIPKCFGVLSNSSSVCSSRGVCKSTNACVCSPRFFGDNCELAKCFGIASTDSSVCSGNGNCSSVDTCLCEIGWEGLNCSINATTNQTINFTNITSDSNTTIPSNMTGTNMTGTNTSITNSTSDSNTTITNSTISNTTIPTINSTNITSDSNTTIPSNMTGTNTSITNSTSDSNTTITNSTISNTTILSNMTGTNTTSDSNTTITNSTISNTTIPTINSTNITSDSNTTIPSNMTGTNTTITNTTSDPNTTITNTTSDPNTTITNSTISNTTIPTINSTNITSDSNTTIPSNMTGTNTTNSNTTITNNTISNTTIPSNITITNTTIANTTTTNTTTFISCFGIDANSLKVCNSNGKCKSTDFCDCYSNSNDGYFTSRTCSKCQQDYYGNSCLSKFVGPLRLSNEANGVEIEITSPYWYNSLNILCSDLIHSDDLKVFGSLPKCYWKEKEVNSFFIEFGNDFNLNIGDSIRFNTFLFESSQIFNYVKFNVESPLNPLKPIAIISTRQVSYSTCENVMIDASNSYSLDRKPLSFIWAIIQSPNPIRIPVSTNISKLFISESSLEGDYIVRLEVESSFTKFKSEAVDFKFTKSNTAFPILSIDDYSTQMNVKTLNIPVIIEKKVSFASCYSNISKSLIQLEWKQISGNQIDFNVNSNNDLVITQFPIKGTNKYLFNVTATFEGKSVSTEVNLQATSENLFSNLYIESMTTSKVSIIVETQDDEQSSEMESWTISCQQVDSQNGCGNVIDNKLSNLALLKQSSFELNSIEFNSIIDKTFSITLTINKGQRIVSSSIQLKFPTETIKLPPLISLLNVSPNKKKLTLNDILNLQLLATKSDGTDLINVERKWVLNGEIIPSSYLEKMSSPISSSNSIILSLTNLVEGSNNELKLTVTDLDTQLSARYSYTFSTAKVPQSCPCIVSPSTGYALETDFTFSCSNCQNKENSLTFSLSFTDDNSGTIIPLVINGGNTFTTKLPYPVSNPLHFNIEIVDSDTGASVKNDQLISILLPLASSIKEVKTKVSKWNSLQNSLQQNDLRRMIFSSAIISRTLQAMISALSIKRSVVKCLNGGQYDSERNKCICKNGFEKKDCSLNLEDFTIVKEFKKELFNNFYSAFENNQKVSEMYLIYQLYGLDSLLSNFDEIDSDIFIKSNSMLMNLVKQANDNNLRVSSGVDNLFSNILNSFYNYLIYNGCENCLKETILQFTSILKSISQLLLKRKYIGESDLKLQLNFISILSNRNYRNHFKNMKTTFDSNYNATLTDFESLKISNRQLLTFISTMTPNYLSELPYILISKTNQINQNGNTITSLFRSDSITSLFRSDSIISKLVSFQFMTDVSLNQSLTFSFANNENMERNLLSENRIEYSCILIQNYTNIIMDTDCKLTMDTGHFYCSCAYQTNSTQIAILKSEFVEKIEEIEGGMKDDSNNFYYLLFLLSIVIVVVVIPVVIIIIVSCCIVVKRKKKPTQTKQEIELPSV